MTSAPQQQFGDRYTLDRLIAVGGMAEIYLARQSGAGGFEKQVVIKRLRPEAAADPRIETMFLEEARLGNALSHPNVVSVFDVGFVEGTPYIAMEYIRGEELSQLCRRSIGLGEFLPLEHAVELVAQAARALGYVHALRHGGSSMDVVHCDISPNNLLVTQDGFIKLIDFGISQSSLQGIRDDRAVPGKLSYMSPEQARRERLDYRSDIFSLGIVLYEITAGERLFRGPASDVYERLVNVDIKPPTFIRRDYPGHLESIVMRALEAHPSDRYRTAYDFADELEEFLRASQLASGPIKIARYLDRLAVAGGASPRPELVEEAEFDDSSDDLDFDRNRFAGFESVTSSTAAKLAQWDEYEEAASEVAKALGIDVALVRHAATLEEGQSPRARTHGGDNDDDEAAALASLLGGQTPETTGNNHRVALGEERPMKAADGLVAAVADPSIPALAFMFFLALVGWVLCAPIG